MSELATADPERDCTRCPRLAQYRAENRQAEPAWFNAPVPSFGDPNARLLIVGLAPGVRGANRTGRPFTGDHAGELLYATLKRTGFASGCYDRRPDDGLTLVGSAVTNAVRCVPPQNKPTPAEIRSCRPFLEGVIARLRDLRAIVALGRIAHESVLRAFAVKLTACPFAHGCRHDLARGAETIALFDSYHCSRYNTNTGVLTEAMFVDVFEHARSYLASFPN